MTDQYQAPDREVADYQIYELDANVLDRQDETPLRLRGPRPEDIETGRYFACIGAAQTFGRFCRDPYPDLLGRMLKMPVLNLGRGGAGFSFFSKNNETLLRYINRSCLAVIQVMAARSEGNSLFRSKGLGYYYREWDGEGIGCDAAFRELLAKKDPVFLRKIVSETRENWVRSCRELLRHITVPKILFWFSTRKPDYRADYEGDLDTLFGEFPQLVNREMIQRVRDEADACVACVSGRGLPQTLRSRLTGRRVTVTDPWGGPGSGTGITPPPSCTKRRPRPCIRHAGHMLPLNPAPAFLNGLSGLPEDVQIRKP